MTPIIRSGQHIARSWMVVVLLFLSAIGAPAHSMVACDSANRRFAWPNSEGHSDATGDAVGYQQYCRWRDGTEILVHTVLDGIPPFTNDSNDTISVWVDKAKWVDSAITQRHQNGDDSYRKVTQIQIDKSGLTLCTIQFHIIGSSDNGEEATGPEVCTKQRRSALPHQPDKQEFPNGRQRLEPPAIRVIASSDPSLCALLSTPVKPQGAFGIRYNLLYYLDNVLAGREDTNDSKGAVNLLRPAFSISHLPDPQPENRIDIDNAGAAFNVFYAQETRRGMTRDRYLVFDDAGIAKLQLSKGDPWATPGLAIDAYPDDWDASEFSAVDSDGKSVSLDMDWPRLALIAYGNATYVVLWDGSDHLFFVVKPLGKKRHETVCTLERIQANP